MKRLLGVGIALVLLVLLATPVFADDSRDRICFGDDLVLRADETADSVVLFGCGALIQNGARVRKDVVSFGGQVVIEQGARVEDDVVVFGGDARFVSRRSTTENVDQSLAQVQTGSVRIAGQVDRDVVVFGGNVILEPTAVIGRDVTVIGGTVDKKEGAVVRGKTERVTDPKDPRFQWRSGSPFLLPFRYGDWSFFNGWSFWDSAFGWFFKNLVNTLALAALGALILVFLPTQLNQVAQVAQKSAAPSLGVGCLTWLVVPPLIVLFVITCLGIPLSLVLGVAFVAAIVLGWIAISVIIGERLLNAFKAKNIVPILSMIVGVIALWLVTSVPVVGWVVWLFIATLAVGAVVLTRFGTRPYPPTALAPVAPTPPVAPSAPAASNDPGVDI